MGDLRMQMMTLSCVLLFASLLAGCGSSSTEIKSAEANPPPKVRPANPDLLSVDGELIPLSAYYSVCAKQANVLRTSIDEGMLGYPTITEITGGAGKLKIGVGKFGVWPVTVVNDIPATSPPRRIQIGSENGNSFILVSDFEGAGNNVVSIDYDEADPKAQADALRFANNVVACHVSAVPSKPNSE
jgi:hypothetical protein